MHVITVSTFYPNAVQPHRAVFVRNLTNALRALSPVTVVAPTPYAPGVRYVARWHEHRLIPTRERIDGVEVYHPRFLAIPGAEIVSGLTYCWGILPTLKRICGDIDRVVLHGHRIYPDGVGVALAARRLGLPYVLTAHGSDINRTARRFGMVKQVRWALKNADAVIAVSQALKSEIVRIEARDIHVIPCAGFDPGVFSVRERGASRSSLALPAAGEVVVFVGQLLRTKGVDVLLDAWARLKISGAIGEDARLVLIGEGPLRESLMRKAQELGVANNVLLTGAIAQQEISAWINSSNALCLPSFMEGTPNVIIEALACGVPVVASRVGGIPEVITHNQNGMLMQAGDASALAACLAQSLARDWDRDVLRAAAEPYMWSNLARRNVAVLQAVGGA